MSLRPRPNALAWLLLSVLVIAVDQLSKAWVLRTLPEYTPVPVIPGFWNWFRTYNTGAAFSFLSDAGGWQKYVFVALALGISALLVAWLARLSRRDWRVAAPYALIVGGALGNAIDRLVHGHVVDFIQWYVKSYYWPSFNIADSALVVGVTWFVLDSLLSGRQARRAARG